MGMRRLPILPTLLVAAAVALMIALGFWQLDRRVEKETMIARYERALASDPVPVAFPAAAGGVRSQDDLFHPAAISCRQVLARSSIAGRNVRGESGFVHVARCLTARGPAEVKLGWSRTPAEPVWDGGRVSGLIVPGGEDGARLQLEQPIANLEAVARPDPADLPNNHFAYAMQWFFFAATALVIYVLALRRRS